MSPLDLRSHVTNAMHFVFDNDALTSRFGPERARAFADFRRMMIWILAIAVLTVAGALTYLGLTGTLDANLVIATILGVFFSVLLGCGLFAAAFFSDKSGHDQSVSDATEHRRD